MKSLATLLVVSFTLGAAFMLCAYAGQARTAQAAAQPAVTCHFDGGGQVTAGNAARTPDGHVRECTQDGALLELSASVRHHAPSAHASLPSWVHWAPASPGAARQVCGRGVAAFTVRGGSGGTSAVVCADGKAETS